MERFTVFDYMFNNEEVEKNFNDFFYKNNLTPLFTNEHKTSPIKVGLIDAKAVVNNKGAYVSILKDFSNLLSKANDNQMYEDATFKVLQTSSNFRSVITKMKRIIKEYQSTKPEHLFNFWNIVFYNKDLF